MLALLQSSLIRECHIVRYVTPRVCKMALRQGSGSCSFGHEFAPTGIDVRVIPSGTAVGQSGDEIGQNLQVAHRKRVGRKGSRCGRSPR